MAESKADKAAAEQAAQEAADAAAQNPAPPPVVDAPPTYEPGDEPTAEAPEQVRLIPVDVWTNALVFPTEETDEAGNFVVATVTSPAPGNRPYLVDADKANDLITVAARHGFAIQKETVR